MDSAVIQSITMFLLIRITTILDIVILDIVILDIVFVKAILDIYIMLICLPFTDSDDGGGGQRSAAVQHHLLPLLPSHHCLPRTACQQVPARKSFQETIENTAFSPQVSPTPVCGAQHHARGSERHQPDIVS